ncbi:MAG TPA: M15 family metallopeptidase [Alphaproteobacteria bacterium]|nr:M15 family metallopeptidase [Alphaproteobacteria bacterium]
MDAKSLHRLKRVWPELQAITRCASKLSALDFRVTEGKRSRDRQRELVAKGASQTMHSLHLEGKAVDIVVVRNGRVSWDFPLYRQVSKSFKRAGKALGYPVEWGGDWHSFKDGPHFQLPRNYS